MKEKHLPYYQVIEAFSESGCPICYLVEKSVDKYFDNLLYENITDTGFRKSYNENQGFCNSHSYKFLGYNDGLAISITHKDLVSEIIALLEKKEYKAFTKETNTKCIVCKYSKETEQRYLSVIAQYFNDVNLKSKYLFSEGLCVQHYRMLLRINKDKIPEWVREFQVKKLKEILVQLERYTESCNASSKMHQSDLSNEEMLIWKRVVRVLFGYKGLNI